MDEVDLASDLPPRSARNSNQSVVGWKPDEGDASGARWFTYSRVGSRPSGRGKCVPRRLDLRIPGLPCSCQAALIDILAILTHPSQANNLLRNPHAHDNHGFHYSYNLSSSGYRCSALPLPQSTPSRPSPDAWIHVISQKRMSSRLRNQLLSLVKQLRHPAQIPNQATPQPHQ